MNPPTARTLTGLAWLIWPLLLLAYYIWSDIRTGFVSLSYYVVSWGSLIALALCGFWFLINGPGAKWVLRVAATVVTLYMALMFLIASGNAPYYGGHNYLMYGLMGAGVAFCAFTFFIASKHAT